ncbi:hypothetical protein RN90_04465 [Fusobacterium animalis]|uniref:Uncharacterized protein n=2 Tax=Fusobacterium TaxID=848 RepID=A0A2B7YY04_9FUSO|nr:hypothetical protein RN90_04465 [Fusobacterium animalis]PHH98170.1 hypothetical protein CA840_06445 [Fusobacterium polymorphum]
MFRGHKSSQGFVRWLGVRSTSFKDLRKTILILSKESKSGIEFFLNISFQEFFEWTTDMGEILERQTHI